MCVKKLLAAAFVAISCAAMAESYSWKELASGSFGEPTNWTPEGVPGTTAADTAKVVFYNQRGDVTISDSAAAGARTFASFDYGETTENRQSWVNTTFDLGGNTWSVTGDWTQYTLGTFNKVTYNPTFLFTDGTINVGGKMKIPRGGSEYGGRYAYVGPLAITATSFGVGGGGTEVVISNGTTITATSIIGLPDNSNDMGCNGGKVKTLLTDQGTKLTCASLRMGQSAGTSGCNGECDLTVTNGAVVKVTDCVYLSCPGANCSSMSNQINVVSGGTVDVIRASSSGYGFRVGGQGNNQFNAFNVRGKDARLYLENVSWYVGDSTTASDNAVRITDGARVDIYAKSGQSNLIFGYGERNRLVAENGGRLEVTSANKNQAIIHLGRGATSSSGHEVVVGNGGYVGIAENDGVSTEGTMNRISLGIGDYFHDNKHDAGGTDCRLVVSNGTYNGWSTDCNIYLGTATADVRAKMRIEGDNASVRAFTCDLGRNAVIEFVPGSNGFNGIPLRLGKNFMWSAGVQQTGTDDEPKMIVDVKNWKPEAHKLDVELVRAAGELSTYLWDTGTNAFKSVVRNAQVRNARAGEHWTVYATDDLKHIRLSFKRDRGLAIILR